MFCTIYSDEQYKRTADPADTTQNCMVSAHLLASPLVIFKRAVSAISAAKQASADV